VKQSLMEAIREALLTHLGLEVVVVPATQKREAILPTQTQALATQQEEQEALRAVVMEATQMKMALQMETPSVVAVELISEAEALEAEPGVKSG
jgi:hypothetical protein